MTVWTAEEETKQSGLSIGTVINRVDDSYRGYCWANFGRCCASDAICGLVKSARDTTI